MISEVNEELYQLCESAATEIIERCITALNKQINKVPVPDSLLSQGQFYTDFLARRSQFNFLFDVGRVEDLVRAYIFDIIGGLSKAEKFSLAAYSIELDEKMPEDPDDPSPDANQVENPVPDDEYLATTIYFLWEESLHEREYPGFDAADDVTVGSFRKGGKCPYCGGKLMTLVYGENPGEEAYQLHQEGKVILALKEAQNDGKDPELECEQCGQWFRRK